MRFLIICISLLAHHSLAQQGLDVRIKNPIIHLDTIAENGGNVFSEIYFVNFGTEKVWVKSTESSCGCSTLSYARDTLSQHQESSLIVAYNPKGRPGYFNKALSVVFTDGIRDITLHLSITGYALTPKEHMVIDELIDLLRFEVYPEDKKKYIKSKEFQAFLSLSTRNLLEDTTLFFSVIQQENKKDVALDKFKKALKDKGLASATEKIILSSLPKNDSFPELSMTLTKRNNMGDSALVLFKNENLNFPIQNLPVYFQYIYSSKRPHLDTSEKRFHEFINQLRVAEFKQEKINFILVTSASKNLNNGIIYKDNTLVAQKRLDETKTRFFTYLQNNGLEGSITNHLIHEFALVTGPEYHYRVHLPKDFNYYQYLIVIPVLETGFKQDDIKLTGYKVNFDYRQVKLDAGSPAFIDFAKRLTALIHFQGYASISIETSSSYSKSQAYWRNDITSYYRGLNTKIELEKLLEQMGVDPLKLIIAEEKHLIQGPKKPKPNEDLTPFQYVKITINE